MPRNRWELQKLILLVDFRRVLFEGLSAKERSRTGK